MVISKHHYSVLHGLIFHAVWTINFHSKLVSLAVYPQCLGAYVSSFFFLTVFSYMSCVLVELPVLVSPKYALVSVSIT